MPRELWKWLLALPLIYLLYFFAMADVGLVGPDEPRYASIGREMARSGDWVTPRLWGEPWFEKPALLYWMVSLGFKAGLGEDLAPRLPVAALSVGFLAFYWRVLRRQFGGRAALLSTLILGTCAGWLAFSHVAVTDLPMTAGFAAAMLLGLRWLDSGDRRVLAAAAALLGVGVLAKGLVPLVLAAPLAWMGRRRLREFLHPWPVFSFLVVAAPWYVLCTARNGLAFLEEFFWRHHFERFATDALHHGQPFWFYVPVLLAGLFPWTPALVPLLRKGFYSDRSRRFLLLWFAFGFVFFSASANKLPGYLLPLFPAAAALAGIALAEMRDARWVLASCCLLMLLIPPIAGTLPRALMSGLSRAPLEGWHWGFAVTLVLLAVLVWWLDEIGRRQVAVALIVVMATLGVVFLKVRSFPAINRLASARPVWETVSLHPGLACLEDVHRNWKYGLNYYATVPIPECADTPRPLRIQQVPGRPPFVH